ncbi:MAG: oligosaccharide flippase family protein [gamma proteobacterium symbiont of Bathyaustriella thionipta]|nr:oligosaccharide flippase family protein [gamma proteobacterium symbiont of Bathyaustriella thionipta]MCU7951621.1 oligosaccharide flippase family protein [gamma proteobacterium symbiont of Bathyaustriella thionipta]MCU7958254.1 oligosaccharide flippase family protein [gamma proteobacterium symbiont of Bathyaustriella thionipta]MCU7967778.1 oligosaccharide flippase family protein [gamma proteobacterium symbiont of Bathyaustriella thionipta]
MPNNDTIEHYSVNKVKKSIFHFLLGKSLSVTLSFIYAIILVRVLSIEDYAAYTVITGLVMIIVQMTNAGIPRVLARYIPEVMNSGHSRQLVSFLMLLTLIRVVLIVCGMLLFVFLFKTILDNYYEINFAAIMWPFLIYTLIYELNMHISRILQSMLEQKGVSFGLSLEWISKLLFVGLAINYYHDFSVVHVLWVSSLSLLLSVLLMCFLLIKKIQLIQLNGNQLTFNHSEIYQLGKFNYLQSLVGVPTSIPVSKVWAGLMLSVSHVSVFGFAQTINAVFMRYLPSRLLLRLIEPVIVSRYTQSHDFSILNRYITTIYKLNVFVLAPATAWMALSAQPVLLAMTDGKYVNSYLVIALLMIVNILESHRLLLEIVVNLIGQSKLLLYSNLWSLLLFPGFFVFMHWFDIYGLILALILIALFRNIYVVHKIKQADFLYEIDFKNVIKLYIYFIDT